MAPMAANENSRSAGSKLATRVGILAVVLGLGAAAHGLLGVGDEPQSSSDSSDTSATQTTPTPSPSDTTSETTDPGDGTGTDGTEGTDPESDPGKDSGSEGNQSDHVPAEVSSGIGDEVGIARLQVVSARTSAKFPAADIAGLVGTTGTALNQASARGLGMVATGQEAIVWRTTTFSLVTSGTEYDAASQRPILWVTLRHNDSGTPVSYVLTRGASARQADIVQTRLSRTSTVIVGTVAGKRAQVAVPDGNAHEGIVLAVRDRAAVAGGVRGTLTLQAPGA